MTLISETLKDALCEQIGHEKYNANLYMYVCGYLRGKGFDNLSKHFLEQHQEETEHSLEFFNLLTDLNAEVYIPEIDSIEIPFENIISVADVYLKREILTTTSIQEILKLAIQDNNPVVEQKMREMVAKQQKEYEEATTFSDKANIMKEWWQVALWDAAGG